MLDHRKALFFIICLVVVFVFSTGCDFLTEAETKPPFPGWDKYSSKEFALYLPDGWEGGSQEDLDYIFELLREMSPELAGLASELEQDKDQILFWAFDTKSVRPDQVMVNFNIAQERTFYSLEDYMEEAYKHLEQAYSAYGINITFLDRDIVSLGSHASVGRTGFELFMGLNMRLTQYLIKKNNVMWILTFTTGQENFHEYAESFDKIIESFEFK